MMNALALRWYNRSSTKLLNELQYRVSAIAYRNTGDVKDLLERLVVDKAGSIFWYFQLPLLDVLAELPRETCRVSGVIFRSKTCE
jgi:hypothetical protein